MPDLLIELFCEEIPARMQAGAARDLQRLVTDALVDAGLTYEGAAAHYGPRRLTLDLRGLTGRSPDRREERKGPRVGSPEKAVAGFLRGAGLSSIDEAEVRTDPKKGEFYVAVMEKPGRAAEEIVVDVMPSIVRAFPWPKSMRWGAASRDPGSLRWVRPLQSILCTLGPETEDPQVVPFEVDGIAASDVTRGHRFHAPDVIQVKRFDDYAAKLQAARVVVSAERRQETIAAQARELAFAQGLELVEDEALLSEVANLVEWPVPLMGTFDEAFLDIPDAVIRLTIKENQKCFVLRGQDGKLTNRFLLVANIEARDGGAEIARGNAKVVNARLSDAKFFWETDLHTVRSEGFEPWLEKLENVTFHAKLGTQAERVRRIEALARELAPVTGADPDKAARAARLAKADLSSQMVYEFPELQGLMGRRYAEVADENESVARAIQEHYSPLGPSDDVPSDPVSVAVALADKLDLLTGFWAIDEKPTGSKDPYALRRAALGVIRLVQENRLSLSLNEAFHGIRHSFPTASYVPKDDSDPRKVVWPQQYESFLSFFHDRLKVFLRDAGARHDLIDAVITPDTDDILTITRRVEALGAFLDTDDGANLLAGFKRAANILVAEEKKGTSVADTVDPGLFEQEEERALFEALERAEREARAAVEAEDFEAAMRALAGLRGPVDAFFEAVLVNADDEAVRANRLALMRRIREATAGVADFSKVAG